MFRGIALFSCFFAASMFAGNVQRLSPLPNAVTPTALQLDTAGNIYVTGTFVSANKNSITAFVAKLAPGGSHVIKDVRYAAHDRGTLDVYEPKHARPGAPVVVFVYGGSWDSGEKAMYRFVGKVLASRGFVTVIPDYRLYPAVKYPDFLRDISRQWGGLAILAFAPILVEFLYHRITGRNSFVGMLVPAMNIRAIVPGVTGRSWWGSGG